jgi:PhnB protein
MSTALSVENAAEVRATLDAYVKDVCSLNVPAIISHYTPDIVAYDAIFKLQFVGRDAYAAHWKECMEHCSVMIFEPRDPEIQVSADLAVGFYLVRCGGTGPDGQEHVGWMRATFAARKVDGRWLFCHEHYSMPIDPMTGKSVEDAQP